VPQPPYDPVVAARTTHADAVLARRAITLLDLTSLTGEETLAEVEHLCRRAIAANVAAICVYPAHLATARALLSGSPVRLAAVANFPHGSDDIAKAADEVAAAVAEGAQEVDVVAPIAAMREGDISLVGDLVAACRAAGGPETVLKLILETGLLESPDRITAAARTAIMAGAGFLKTSTGKSPVGATLEAAAVLLTVIAEAGGRIGLKISGGVHTPDEAAAYIALASHMMGETWITPERFRIGASSLLEGLLGVAGQTGS
jgi:deoxyribose-phosphate aldolase